MDLSIVDDGIYTTLNKTNILHKNQNNLQNSIMWFLFRHHQENAEHYYYILRWTLMAYSHAEFLFLPIQHYKFLLLETSLKLKIV